MRLENRVLSVVCRPAAWATWKLVKTTDSETLGVQSLCFNKPPGGSWSGLRSTGLAGAEGSTEGLLWGKEALWAACRPRTPSAASKDFLLHGAALTSCGRRQGCPLPLFGQHPKVMSVLISLPLEDTFALNYSISHNGTIKGNCGQFPYSCARVVYECHVNHSYSSVPTF